VRWWLTTDPPRVFSVDNAAVKGMDFSALAPDIWMIQWTDGKGEIERQNDDGENLNGLRETFIDVIPFAPLFQQFLQLIKAKALLLPQAKKVQVDLIREIFEGKRQAPYHYPVAAGDYWWDATDETLFSSTAAGLQNAIASINAIAARLNSVIPALNANDASLATQATAIKDTIASYMNAYIVGAGNNLVNEINAWIVGPANASITATNGIINGIYAHTNSAVIDSFNSNLMRGNIQVGETSYSAAVPGMPPGGVPYAPTTLDNNGLIGVDVSFSWYPIAGSAVTPVPWTTLPNVAVANANWIPVGATAPVNVTPAEQAAIMSGIAARTAALNVTKNTKIGQVNALTDIDAVIAYNVTTGW
jgi:hypothetical protein